MRFFKNLKKYSKYAKRSAKAELKSEVADSYLNWLWWVIEPFCFMLIYTFIFSVVFKNKTQYFPAFIFIGLTCWEFFNRMVNGSVRLIPNNRDLVTKVYLPKYILLVSKSFTYAFKMGISMIIAFILMIALGVPFTWKIIFIIPIFIVLYIVSFGISTILMHFGVTLSDLSNLTNIVLRMVFYLAGVFYSITDRLADAGKVAIGPLHFKISTILLKANPVAFLMDQMRQVMLYGSMPNWKWLGIWLVLGIGLCAIGVHVIHKNENSYAKVI